MAVMTGQMDRSTRLIVSRRIEKGKSERPLERVTQAFLRLLFKGGDSPGRPQKGKQLEGRSDPAAARPCPLRKDYKAFRESAGQPLPGLVGHSWTSPSRAGGGRVRLALPRPGTAHPAPAPPRPAPVPPYLAPRPRPGEAAGGQGPRDVARSRACPHHVQQRQRGGTQGRRGAAGREHLGGAGGPGLPPHPRGPAESGADGQPADRLHLREELPVDQPERLQILRSGHHLQLDHDPRLLPGPPLPPLPRAHLHQLAPVGTPALFNRHPAPPHRLHRGRLQELQPERAGGRLDLRLRGHLPLPGERVAVLQGLLCDPVHRCSRLRTPRPPGPQEALQDVWPRRQQDPRARDLRRDLQTCVPVPKPCPAGGHRRAFSSLLGSELLRTSLPGLPRRRFSSSGKEKQPPGRSVASASCFSNRLVTAPHNREVSGDSCTNPTPRGSDAALRLPSKPSPLLIYRAWAPALSSREAGL